jgi:hypothetical protein
MHMDGRRREKEKVNLGIQGSDPFQNDLLTFLKFSSSESNLLIRHRHEYASNLKPTVKSFFRNSSDIECQGEIDQGDQSGPHSRPFGTTRRENLKIFQLHFLTSKKKKQDRKNWEGKQHTLWER